MARAVFIDDKGRQVGLGKQLGRGGEATVYAVEGEPGIVAKVYHRSLMERKPKSFRAWWS